MAEKILNTRILLKVDTLENWNKSTLALKKGEIAIATVAATAGTGLTEPVCMIKIGEDGVKTFKDLSWNFYAKASDVLSACKTEAGLTAFINGVIANAGLATGEALNTLAGRVTTAEGEIDTLQSEMDAVEAKAAANETAIGTLNGLVGSTKVADQISAAIAALELANTYEAKGEAAKVSTALETYKTSNDAAVQKNASDLAGEISRAKAAEEANANAISAIKDGTTIDSFADVETALAGKDAAGAAAQALTDAKAYADGLAVNYDEKGSAATAESNAKAYADGLAQNYDATGSAAQALTDAKAYTDEEIVEWVGTKTVGAQITEAITGLDLANTYDAKGAAAQALADAKVYANGLDTAMNTRVEALEAIDHDHANADELAKIADGDVAKWNAAEQNAKDYADGLDSAMDTRMQAIEAKFGDGEGNVESQIAAAVGAEKTRAEGIEAGLRTDVDAIKGDYLKAADKTELEGKITANANAIELLTNGVSPEEVDGVNDLIQYVKDHGTEVTGIKNDIKANADAIDVIEADYLKAADKTELAGDITALEGRMDTAEGAIATKAAQSDLTALAGRVTTVEGDLNTETTGLKARMTAAEGDIDALETEVAKKANNADLAAIAKTGNVNDLIQTAGDVIIFDCGNSGVTA